jgi:hypothetical protein
MIHPLTFTSQTALSRRTFLRAAGISLALPWLDAMQPACAAEATTPTRFVGILNQFGFVPSYFFPEETGPAYAPSPHLQILNAHRDVFTVVSGLSHPEVHGGHNCDPSFFTGAIHPGAPTFRNTVSLDQVIAETVGQDSRYPALSLSTNASATCSYTRGGVAIPAASSPEKLFARCFINGSPQEVAREVARLQRGHSIMDRLLSKAKSLGREVGPRDREKLDQYFTSVRAVEQRLVRNEQFAKAPKPDPKTAPIQDPGPGEETAKLGLLLEVTRLAMQADLTRAAVLFYSGTSKTPSDPRGNFAHHDLTHHGQSPEKLEDLTRLERDLLAQWGGFLQRLKETPEAGARQIDHTITLMGSALGNAALHNNFNLPILLAGGGFKHGQHLAFQPDNAPPLCNLYLQILQRMGVETSSFGTSKGVGLPGLVA